MKEKQQEKLLFVLIAMIVGVAVYYAKTIGDKVTSYQSYKLLHSVVRLSHPVHQTIDQMQNERTLTSIYLAHQSPEQLKAITDQYQESDKSLDKFAKNLKLTEMLLLSIPESDLALIRKDIQDHRTKLDSPSMAYKNNYHFYNAIIAKFEDFLEKMYTYSDAPSFLPLISSLMHSEFLKDSIAKECSFVSYHLSMKEIVLGEIPLIRQMLSEQMFHANTFNAIEDPELKSLVTQIYTSPERAALFKLRERFEVPEPSLKGSFEVGKNYLDTCSAYLKQFSRFDETVIRKLELIAKAGKEKFKTEIIWSATFGIAAIFLLVGIYILIRKVITA